jgi:hypothetical protein
MCRHGPVTSISRSIASPQHSGRRIYQEEAHRFSVVFDETDRWNAYLDNANCWPELEQVDGFVDNIGYRSLTCEDGFSCCPAGATKSRGPVAAKRHNTVPRWSATGTHNSNHCQRWRMKMPYFLFSTSRKSRISEVFVTEREVWVHVRAQGLCSEVIDREDRDPRRILYPDYEIHFCDAAGRRLGDAAIRGWPGAS